MTDTNQVYNSHFRLWQENNQNFPDGWAKIGGDPSTEWIWSGVTGGPKSIKIIHPSGPRAGIILENNVVIPAGENQRWEFRAILEAEPAGVTCYIKVYLGVVSQYLSLVRPGSQPEEISRIISTPIGVTGLRVEVGILGEGIVTIYEIEGRRLYPKQELRLDEKGQLYVRHVDSIGKIQTPVSVRVESPLPIPVDVKTPVKAELRDLTPARDGIKIYSSNGNSIESTLDGLLQVKMSGRTFRQSVETVTSSHDSRATKLNDVSQLSVFSYAIFNMGMEVVRVQLQISPDGAVWTSDDSECDVLPGALAVITPNRFLRFVRLIYYSQSNNPLTIWFQAQT
ncbi:hypothetical protein Desor_0320 [Desulfosporosinus orientis DSM 765]|uniref:DUF6385 domain-containing protein n=1 Tax=Desulfosporosinus orientis (strain ATCC 19365 / DSM 765 / NCIMB 8382 / VKM B-1628 / Singapore I) TaxID=768706 RepID=G7W518_DESOD|nr:DUF6385 domain-containing protein [Desulfosporosinus orientis]AET66034.1 hypothetical protein Desor_0320 [Desulfosporosinus orientis DSM 765]